MVLFAGASFVQDVNCGSISVESFASFLAQWVFVFYGGVRKVAESTDWRYESDELIVSVKIPPGFIEAAHAGPCDLQFVVKDSADESPKLISPVWQDRVEVPL